MHIFHKWKYIKVPYETTFMGEPITRYTSNFRVCLKCGGVQEEGWCEAGIYWSWLDDDQIHIMKHKLNLDDNFDPK